MLFAATIVVLTLLVRLLFGADSSLGGRLISAAGGCAAVGVRGGQGG